MNGLRAFLLSLGAAAGIVACTVAHATPSADLAKAVSIDDVRDTRRLLQEHLVDPRARDAQGDTILIAAIRSDAQRVVDYLLADPTTDVNATNVSNETALMIAAYRKRAAVVEQLLARHAVVNRSGWTALHYAASVDAGDIVAMLLKDGAAIDARSPNRTTPLMMAARGRYDDVCRQLIAAGADPTATNDSDLTAADFAKRASDPELAGWLAGQASTWRAQHGTRDQPKPGTSPRPDEAASPRR